MSVRFYLNKAATSQVSTERLPETKNTSVHTRHELNGERVSVRNGEFYFEEFGCLLKMTASADFMKNIGRVTASYSGPRRSVMRESGFYQLGNATAIVEPTTGAVQKDSYETYEVTLTGDSLDSVKTLLLAIIEGSIRPERSLHGNQQGLPSPLKVQIIADQKRTIAELQEQLVRAKMVLDSFSAVYGDYQRLVKEQRAVIESHRQ